MSPHHVQPSEQIVLRAEATSVSATAFVEWQKGNITYTNHINEDPQCNPDRDVSMSHVEINLIHVYWFIIRASSLFYTCLHAHAHLYL